MIERKSDAWTTWSRLGFIAFAYALAHGLDLLNRGLYWDDWVFWQQDRRVVAEAARAMGSTWLSSINDLFYYSQGGITLNRVIGFVALLVAAFLFYDIARRLPRMSNDSAMWLAVLFAVFPTFEARIAMVMIGYSLSLVLFMFGLWFLVLAGPKPHPVVRLFTAALFLSSFRTGSLLVFFAVVPAVLLAIYPPGSWSFKPVIKRLFGYADQLVLPFLYWGMTRIWFRPSGLYANYNEVGGGQISAVMAFARGLYNVLAGPVLKAAVILPVPIPLVVAVVAAALVAPVVLRRYKDEPTTRAWIMFAIGMTLLVLAVFPYAAVGKVPENGWDSRHQLLVPFGGAFVFFSLVTALRTRKRLARAFGSALLIVIVGASVAINVWHFIEFERDWMKQQALMEEFKLTPEIESASFILLYDQTADIDYNNRMFYEYSGMLAEVFGNQSRLCIPAHLYSGNGLGDASDKANQPYYKLADFAGGKPEIFVTVKRETLEFRSNKQVLRLLWLEWTDQERFHAELRKFLTLDVHVLTPKQQDEHGPHLVKELGRQ